MISIPRFAFLFELALAIVLSITWLTIIGRQLSVQFWRKTHVQAAYYQDASSQLIGVLQQIQTLYYSEPAGVRLSDLQTLIQRLQRTHGEHATLEAVIQSLAGQHLLQQVRLRQGRARATERAGRCTTMHPPLCSSQYRARQEQEVQHAN